MEINIADIRQDYSKKELSIAECANHPIEQFNTWFEEAIKAQVMEPNAMTVSAVSKEGRPSARTVLLKGIENDAFVFYTNYNSRKGQHLAANKYAALTFFWPELERQVNIEGRIEQVAEEVSDKYFKSRPYKSRVGAWASEQSQEISSKSVVMTRFAKYATKYITHVPRPPHWGGYGIIPDRIEFWQGRPSRLHDRVLYVLENGQWLKKRLAP
ncbi:pyridoxamine 5'-phosphate oxidase [Persicobacter psychrovividus]|uniref:Pyridoxine/pyridoxamine 5'-phosphate oxidase n=1 Tax=Persicobacter psychrovividus TaxID=387638 RepID=A0ABM7VEL7_9BACT|nr:pyridoxine/pyridoxamine 5'-phosphate oxidase [Persicobacter psychrovividus]